MASTHVQQNLRDLNKTYNLKDILAILEDNSDIEEADRSISSSEESELNHQNSSDDSRWVRSKP